MQRKQFLNEMVKLKEAQELRHATFTPITKQNSYHRVTKSQDMSQSKNEFMNNTFDINQQKMVIKEGQPMMIDQIPKPKMEKTDQQKLGRRLMEYGYQLQLRKAAAKHIQDQQERDNCEFKPKINQKSIEMVNQKKQQNMSIIHTTQKLYGNSHLKRNNFAEVKRNLRTQQSLN